MRSFTKILGSTFLVLFVLAAAPAGAQVCGDATGNGVVNDADAVQVLRAAAEVSSQCGAAVCDVNADGGVNDTDAVVTLRLAAGLSAETSCDFGGGGDDEVGTLAMDLTPFFGILLPEAPAIGAGGAGAINETEDCPGGGTRTRFDTGLFVQVRFNPCRIDDPILGSYEFDGSVSLNLELPQFFVNVDITDLTTGRLVNFEGPFDPTFGGGDTVVFDGGPVVIMTPQGNFDMTFDGLVVDSDGRPRGGAAAATDTDDNFALDVLSFGVNDDITANLVADFDDGSTATFLLNLVTGDLTPTG